MFPGWKDPFANDRSAQVLRQGLSRAAAPYAQQFGRTLGRLRAPWMTPQNGPMAPHLINLLKMMFPGSATGGPSYGTKGRR